MLAKSELINNYKSELKSLYDQIDCYKEKNQKLTNEINSYKEALNSDSMCEIQPNTKDLTQKVETICSLRKAAENNADFFKYELLKKLEEIQELKTELDKARAEHTNTFRKDELKKLLIQKDDQMKTLNKKFQQMTSKLDSLLQEKFALESEKKHLESEKKRLSERWHQ